MVAYSGSDFSAANWELIWCNNWPQNSSTKISFRTSTRIAWKNCIGTIGCRSASNGNSTLPSKTHSKGWCPPQQINETDTKPFLLMMMITASIKAITLCLTNWNFPCTRTQSHSMNWRKHSSTMCCDFWARSSITTVWVLRHPWNSLRKYYRYYVGQN